MDYTLPEFLAHAIALEHEAAERYLELAEMMEAHRNDEDDWLARTPRPSMPWRDDPQRSPTS